MFIVPPMNMASGGGIGGGLSNLFRTHPATEMRIAKLREMG